MNKHGLPTAAAVTLTAGLLCGATSAWAANSSESVEQCQSLAAKFKAADMTKASADKLQSAKQQAAQGEKNCASQPEAGIKAIKQALSDIGVEQE